MSSMMEQILGKKRAESCMEELEDRKHREDTDSFRKELIREIVFRHVSDKNLTIKEIKDLMDSGEQCYCDRMINNLTHMIIGDMKGGCKSQ